MPILIKESTPQIVKIMHDLIQKEINKALPQVATKVQSYYRTLIRLSIERSPEFKQISKGKRLAGELGIPYGEGFSRLDDIVSEVMKMVSVVQTKDGLSVVFDLKYDKLLRLKSASYVTNKGKEIPWLEFLLLRGNSVIIREFSVVFNRSPESRSGTGAIMIKDGGFFQVSPQWSGNPESNFITRSIEKIDNQVIRIMMRSLKEVLK